MHTVCANWWPGGFYRANHSIVDNLSTSGDSILRVSPLLCAYLHRPRGILPSFMPKSGLQAAASPSCAACCSLVYSRIILHFQIINPVISHREASVIVNPSFDRSSSSRSWEGGHEGVSHDARCYPSIWMPDGCISTAAVVESQVRHIFNVPTSIPLSTEHVG